MHQQHGAISTDEGSRMLNELLESLKGRYRRHHLLLNTFLLLLIVAELVFGMLWREISERREQELVAAVQAAKAETESARFAHEQYKEWVSRTFQATQANLSNFSAATLHDVRDIAASGLRVSNYARTLRYAVDQETTNPQIRKLLPQMISDVEDAAKDLNEKSERLEKTFGTGHPVELPPAMSRELVPESRHNIGFLPKLLKLLHRNADHIELYLVFVVVYIAGIMLGDLLHVWRRFRRILRRRRRRRQYSAGVG
jgi:hypothetical protein